jgi:dTDP-4-dehydrorhamnose reductase
MAGHILYDYLNNFHNNDYQIIGLSKNVILGYTDIKCDAQNLVKLETELREIRPNIVVNCIGALISQSKINPSNAVFLNAYLPLVLSEHSVTLNFKLIHLSTDCVFSGTKGNYSEDDYHDAKDIYGKSKSLGELIDLKSNCVLRTSIIGPEIRKKNEGLFDWIMKQNGLVYGYKQAFWSGITTLELSKCITEVIKFDLNGIFHVTNGKPISKFDLLKTIKDQFDLKQIELGANLEYETNKSMIESIKFDFRVPSYRNQIKNLHEYMINSGQGIYDRYF